MQKDKVHQKVKNLISRGEIELAIKELNLIEVDNQNTKEIIIQSNKHSNLKEAIRNGTIAHDDAERTMSKICLALLEIIDNLDQGNINPTKPPDNTNPSNTLTINGDVTNKGIFGLNVTIKDSTISKKKIVKSKAPKK